MSDIVSEKWPDLAKVDLVLIRTPVGSAEVQRSFSALGRILTPQRTFIKSSTVVSLQKLHYNAII